MSAALPWHACIDGSNIDADIDDGGNAGLVNGGAVQCRIAGEPCL